GNLYGTTFTGGASNDGTVFKLASGSTSITTLASFNGANAANPIAGVIVDASGNLYGTTDDATTPPAAATLASAATNATQPPTLATFNANTAPLPGVGLVRDAGGNLYGTAYASSSPPPASNNGTVYKLASGATTLTVLASFDGASGAFPRGGLIRDTAGILYGT